MTQGAETPTIIRANLACDIRHGGCEPAFIAPNAPYDENGQLYNF